jgi:Tfp pilus assembly protein PilF
MKVKKINLIFMWSGWVFGLVGTVIAVLVFIGNYNNQSRSDLKEVIELLYETSELMGLTSSGPNTFSTSYERGKEYDVNFDTHKMWENLNKLEVMGQENDAVVALKLMYVSKLKDQKIIKKYLDELGDELSESQKNFALGMILSKDIDQVDLALDYIQKAVSLDPESIEMRSIYALSLHSVGRNDESIEQFKIVLSQSNTDINIINHFGHVLLESRQFNEARDLLLNSVNNGTADTGTYNVLGYLYTVLNDFKLAKKYFRDSIDKDFLNPLPHRNLSLILKKLGDLDGAKTEARLASKYGWPVPDGADYRNVMD